MKYALFLGCTVPARGRNYEMSARLIANRFGIEFLDIPEFGCCGFPMKSTEFDLAELMSARVLAQAEAAGSDICVLCSACNANLAEANHALREDSHRLATVNKRLAKIGLHYNGTTEIKHFSRILYEEIGLETLRNSITKPLTGFLIAPHLGCHYLKPSEVFGGFDSVEHPQSLFELVQVTGARVTRLMERKHCCGGSVLAYDPTVSYGLAGQKLQAAKDEDADAICLICPFCSVIYDDNQKSIARENDTEFEIPVLYYPQLLGLAMGMKPKSLGLNLNRIDTREFINRLEGSD